MKKVISFILLLALCISCFAGCADQNQEAQGKSALEQAKEYLFAMYKDAPVETTGKYTVVSQIRIGEVVYAIEWTTDKTDNVTITAGENNQTIVATTGGPEEIEYKLIGTIKDADGNSVSVSFKHTIPAVQQIEDGTVPNGNFVLIYPKENKYITGSHYLYTGKNKWQLNLTENESEAVALTGQKNPDGTITFKSGEYYLFCDATHVQFVKEQSDYTKFVLEAADTDGGYYIKCAVANYQGKAQYLEVYSGYLTCYGMGTDPSIYVFKLQESTTAAGTISGLEDNNGGNTDSGNTDSGNNNSGNTGNNSGSNNSGSNNSGNTGNNNSGSNNSGNTGNNNSGNNNSGSTNTPANGTKVVFSYPKENQYVTGKHYAYTSSKGYTKMELELSDKKADALVMEMIKNSDNTVSFKAGSQYLFCDATDVKFVSSQSDNTKFVLETADGGYFIKCAVANYQGKAQYLEVYGGYLTCYSMGTDPSIYVFKLDSASGASGSISDQDGSNAGSSSSGSSNSGSSNSGSSNSGSSNSGSTTVNGKLAASLNMEGDANATNHTSSQTVYAANGITYTNDKASSQTANIAPPAYSARAYKSSTIKVEYTGMVAIVFNLDDHSNGQYLTGFDGMEVAGATITRSGSTVTITFASATNVFQSAELGAQVRIKSIDVYTAK